MYNNANNTEMLNILLLYPLHGCCKVETLGKQGIVELKLLQLTSQLQRRSRRLCWRFQSDSKSKGFHRHNLNK
jgi:hypothetical protein